MKFANLWNVNENKSAYLDEDIYKKTAWILKSSIQNKVLVQDRTYMKHDIKDCALFYFWESYVCSTKSKDL